MYSHCTEGWVGLRARLDRCEKSCPHRDSIPGPSSPQRVATPNVGINVTQYPVYGPHRGHHLGIFKLVEVITAMESTRVVAEDQYRSGLM